MQQKFNGLLSVEGFEPFVYSLELSLVCLPAALTGEVGCGYLYAAPNAAIHADLFWTWGVGGASPVLLSCRDIFSPVICAPLGVTSIMDFCPPSIDQQLISLLSRAARLPLGC